MPLIRLRLIDSSRSEPTPLEFTLASSGGSSPEIWLARNESSSTWLMRPSCVGSTPLSKLWDTSRCVRLVIWPTPCQPVRLPRRLLLRNASPVTRPAVHPGPSR